MSNMFNCSALVLSCLIGLGCAQENSHIVTKAPQSNAEVGFVIKDCSVSQNLLQDFVVKNNGQMRVVNQKHCITEVYGIDKATIVNELSPKSIFKNSVKKLKINSQQSPQSLLTLSDDETEESTEDTIDCKENPSMLEMLSAPTPVFTVSIEGEEESLTTREHVSIAIESLDKVIKVKLETKSFLSVVESNTLMKVVMPRFSGADPVTIPGTEFELKLPMAGTYQVVAAAQSKPGAACKFISMDIFSSDNPELIEVSAEQIDFVTEQIDLSIFPHLEQINAIEAQAMAPDEEVIVAILDTGIDYNNPMLNNKILLNEDEIPNNGIDDDGNGMVDDYIGPDLAFGDAFPYDDMAHGTHVAGLIGAEFTGVSQNVKFIPVKVGSGMGLDIASVISGIYYSVDRGAQIINASLGSYELFEDEADEETLQELQELLESITEAIEYAKENNVLFITSSGNGDLNDGESMDNDQRAHYPSSIDLDNILSITAVDEDNELAPYANYGKTSVDLSAPGGIQELPLLSTIPGNISNQVYGGMNGTSMATPVVAGVAALLLSDNPDLTPSEVISILMESGDKVEGLKDITASGAVVNAAAALEQDSVSDFDWLGLMM